MKKFSLALLLIFCFSTPFFAHCGELEDTFAAAKKAFSENNFPEAIANFSKLADMLIKKQQIPQARLVLGNVAAIHIKQENYADAVKVYTQALELKGKVEPDFQKKAWGNLAVCHHYLNEYALKAQYLEKLIKAFPKEKNEIRADWYAQLGDAYKALEIYSKAVAAYENASKLLPKDQNQDVYDKILTGWALCAGNLGDFSKAETLLAEVLKNEQLEPLTKAESSSNLGILKWEQGDYPQASELISQALEIEKASTLRRNEGVDTNNYGLVLKSAGRHEEALNYFKNSIAIAKEVGNVRDEAIALSNMALVYRILGEYGKAKNAYTQALNLYQTVSFKEGQASTLLGLGKLCELENNDYNSALDYYRQANALYEELEIPRGVAESLNQLGRVLRKASAPKRATRDLVFEDDEITLPAIEPAAALQESVDAYTKALAIAEKLNMRELIWSAHQGLGFALNESGQKAEALQHYEKAIGLVTTMRGSKADAELLGEYLKDKKDLFTESKELCSALYKETNDPKYMFRAMELDEVLRNEIVKANTQVASMNYVEKDKQDLYNKILQVSVQQEKVASHTPAVNQKQELTNEEKQQNALVEAEAKNTESKVKTLDKAYNTLLAEWKKRYPEDAALFDSSAKIDTKQVQASLADDEVVLNYMSLPDSLVIVSIAKEFVRIYVEPVAAKDLDKIIKTDFLYNCIEKDARGDIDEPVFSRAVNILQNMYGILIEPVKKDIQNKDKLIIVSSGFLASFPFSALVSDLPTPLQPTFLVEEKEIVNSRLSFFTTKTAKPLPDTLTVLAAGNPRNEYISTKILSELPGAQNEIMGFSEVPGLKSDKNNIRFQTEATESWFKEAVKNNSYNIIYFATHGMPFSDTYVSYQRFDKSKEGPAKEDARPSFEYMKKHLEGITPLNGYLYMAASNEDDGLFTVKEIMELPNQYFANTQLILLSACNTGVTFAPKSLGDDEIINQFNSETIQKEMVKLGWTPEVDQISFVDTFMKKGASYAYGTLWFADDSASAFILKAFSNKITESSIPTAYTQAIREYLALTKENKLNFFDDGTILQHPFFWACGTIFGN